MWYREPGVTMRTEYRAPSILADASFRCDAADGEVLGPFEAAKVSITRLSVDGYLKGSRHTDWIQHGIRIFATDSRVLYGRTLPEKDGTYSVGHLRYSWIQQVSFTSAAGWLNPPRLHLTVGGGPSRGDVAVAWLNVVFDLPKEVDAAGLAQAITQRAARHDLGQVGFPAQHRDAMEALASAPRLPAPAKKEFSDYDFPTYREWPGSPSWLFTTEETEQP
jgi:hypothetical protein